MAARPRIPNENLSFFVAKPVAKPVTAPAAPYPKAPDIAPEEDVTIEAAEEGWFWLSFTRDHGTSRGSVRVSRGQLEKLLRRIPGALEVG